MMMRKLPLLARFLLGLVFVVFGFDGLVHFFPLPPMPVRAAETIAALSAYRLFHVVKGLEIVCGALLLSGRHVLAALGLLAPILFNILWFDANLDPASLPIALILSALEAYLLWGHRAALASLWSSSPRDRA